MDGVQAGERLTDRRVDHPVAALHPLLRRSLGASTLIERWCRLPYIDPVRLHSDIDDLMDPSL